MNLPIAVFEIMAETAKENKVRSIKWAKASGIEPSRISEYKRMAKKTKTEQADSEEEREVHGHFIIEKLLRPMGRVEETSREQGTTKRSDQTA